jgi:hypothetical protein
MRVLGMFSTRVREPRALRLPVASSYVSTRVEMNRTATRRWFPRMDVLHAREMNRTRQLRRARQNMFSTRVEMNRGVNGWNSVRHFLHARGDEPNAISAGSYSATCSPRAWR